MEHKISAPAVMSDEYSWSIASVNSLQNKQRGFHPSLTDAG